VFTSGGGGLGTRLTAILLLLCKFELTRDVCGAQSFTASLQQKKKRIRLNSGERATWGAKERRRTRRRRRRAGARGLRVILSCTFARKVVNYVAARRFALRQEGQRGDVKRGGGRNGEEVADLSSYFWTSSGRAGRKFIELA